MTDLPQDARELARAITNAASNHVIIQWTGTVEQVQEAIKAETELIEAVLKRERERAADRAVAWYSRLDPLDFRPMPEQLRAAILDEKGTP